MPEFSNPSHVRVLVVDDDAQVRSIVADYLRSFGFEHIHEAKDGGSAIKYLQNKQKIIDLVISDWEMPHADGLTVLKAVRKNPERSETRFVMLTSQRSMERFKIAQAAQWRVDAYIVKPFKGDVLREKVFAVLGLPDGDSDGFTRTG